MQRRAVRASIEAMGENFTEYRDKLERVEPFKYLGRLISFNNTDVQAMRSNLQKA